MIVTFTINGRSCQIDVPGDHRLLDVLRVNLGLTGTKEGCGEGECGACSVLLDGQVVNACLIPVAQVDGAQIVTVEGLEAAGGGPLQEAFVALGAAQCGSCTPGMLMSAYGHFLESLRNGDDPQDREGIRHALAGNLCRCTGYQKIIDAVSKGYEELARMPSLPPAAPAPQTGHNDPSHGGGPGHGSLTG